MSFKFFGHSFYFLDNSMQIEKAFKMLEKYIFKPEIVVVLLVLALYFIVRVIAKIRKNNKLLNFLKSISPWVYLIVILGITVLNRTPGDRELRLVFDSWFTQNGFHESNVLGFMFNLVLYIPFGYLLCKYGKTISAVVIVCLSSFVIEALQYILARGVSAIDDFIANVLGGLIGLGFAVLLQKIKDKKHDLE